MNSNRKEDMEISSHYRQLLRELSEQRQHGILCDACVIVEGKIFKAHKNVLLGSSRYFKTLYCQVGVGDLWRCLCTLVVEDWKLALIPDHS
jgi:zinc finger/BTB domain-containing protein 46